MSLSMFRTEYDWQYHTDPNDKYCRSFESGCYWPRGKMLGGSHGINAMIYLRGNREDYDNWYRLGNPTWDYDSVLKYFKKTERNLNQSYVMYQNKKWHSDEGAMPVNQYIHSDDIRYVYLNAAKERGYDEVHDLNADKTLGFTHLQGTTKNGMRFSTAKSLLASVKERKNLHIIKHAHATKISVDNSKTATGVEFIYKNSHSMVAKTKKEIILSAGAISSPQLLMLSGIGRKTHLEKMGITPIIDLSVGQNLQDHVVTMVPFQFHKSTAKPESLRDILDDIYNYAIHKTGPLTGVGSVDLGGFINTENHTGYPDIETQYFHFKRNSIFLENKLRTFGYKENVIKTFLESNAEGELNIVFIDILRPESIGEIRLNSKNPFEAPKIMPNYFAKEADVKTLVRGIKFITSFLDTKAFKEHEGSLVRIPLEDCDRFEFKSDDYWKCYLSHMSATLYHPIGTAKMGPTSDKESVVDSELKVKGINGLRVIDASIMPKIVSANINAATIMIAEKGADFIKSTWKSIDRSEL